MRPMKTNQGKNSLSEHTDIPVSVRLNPSWRTYQKTLQEKNQRKGRGKKFRGYNSSSFLPWYLPCTVSDKDRRFHLKDHSTRKQESPVPSANIMQEHLAGKKAVQKLLEGHSFLNLDKKLFPVMVGETRLWVETSLDMELQQYLLKVMNVSHARYIGIVVMEPETGKIRAMVGYDKHDGTNTTLVWTAVFPPQVFLKSSRRREPLKQHRSKQRLSPGI
jgi:hypothetical protein